MADDLARFSGEPAPRVGAKEAYFKLEADFRSATSSGVPAIDIALTPIAFMFREAATNMINQLAETEACSDIDHEIISEHVFRRLGDLLSAMDNVRAIARDLSYADLHMICERIKHGV
ncbi:hypothetical protein AB6J89_004708 [Salmonella enterica]